MSKQVVQCTKSVILSLGEKGDNKAYTKDVMYPVDNYIEANPEYFDFKKASGKVEVESPESVTTAQVTSPPTKPTKKTSGTKKKTK